MSDFNLVLVVVLLAEFLASLPVVFAANPSAATVSTIIPALVQISGLNNITLSPTSFASPVEGSTTACVYTNTITPLGSYFVTASSANASAGSFRITNNSVFITYSAFWNPSASALHTEPLSSGSKTAQQLNGNGTSLTCSGSPNANFNISISAAQVNTSPPGVYTDNVTLLISPT